MSSNNSPSLGFKNILNLLSFAANITVTYGIGYSGWLHTPTNAELSEKYQTLLTPNNKAFLIWPVIFAFQAVFIILQLLPPYRGVDMVQKGVGFWYFLASALQIGWTITFAYEIIYASLACMWCLWFSLMGLVYSQYYAKSDGTIWEFIFLRFPFSLHGGWITAALALNVNVTAVYMEQPVDIQLAVAILSIAVLHAISVWALFNVPRPNWTIAGVLSWAFGWIYVELQDPKPHITDTFGQTIINAVAYASVAVGAGVIPAQFVVRLFLYAWCKGNAYTSKIGRGNETTRCDQIAPVVEPETTQGVRFQTDSSGTSKRSADPDDQTVATGNMTEYTGRQAAPQSRFEPEIELA